MNRFERQIVIDADPETVFDYVSDLTKHREWATNPIEMTISSPGPIREGTRFRAEVTIMGKRGADDGRVTEYVRPSRFAFETQGTAGIVQNWFALRPTETGGCVLVKGSDNTSPSRFSVVMVPVLRLMAPRWYDRNLRTIKGRIESETDGPPTRPRQV